MGQGCDCSHCPAGCAPEEPEVSSADVEETPVDEEEDEEDKPETKE